MGSVSADFSTAVLNDAPDVKEDIDTERWGINNVVPALVTALGSTDEVNVRVNSDTEYAIVEFSSTKLELHPYLAYKLANLLKAAADSVGFNHADSTTYY